MRVVFVNAEAIRIIYYLSFDFNMFPQYFPDFLYPVVAYNFSLFPDMGKPFWM